MKKLLYFLIGVFIPMVLAAPYTYADVCRTNLPGINPTLAAIGYKEYVNEGTRTGGCSEWRDAKAASLGSSFAGTKSYAYWNGVGAGTFWVSAFHSSGSGHTAYYVNCISTCPPVGDEDNDGMPDDCDQYPDDDTPYSVKLVGYQTAEGTVGGTHVRETYQTDRGDYYTIGNDFDVSLPSMYVAHGTWIDPSAHCNSTDGQQGTSTGINTNDDNAGTTASNNPTVIADGGDGTSGSGPDDSFRDGTDPDGTESAADQKIIQNTSDTASNIKDLTKYLKDINTGIGNVNKALIANGDWRDGMEEESPDDITPEDGTNATTAAGNSDTEYSDAQTSITGEASLEQDAPEDFQEKTDIPTKMEDYLTNNPISAIIENTGISISGSTSTVNWSYNGKSIPMTISGFDSELEAFGQILVAMATLAGMLLIFRG